MPHLVTGDEEDGPVDDDVLDEEPEDGPEPVVIRADERVVEEEGKPFRPRAEVAEGRQPRDEVQLLPRSRRDGGGEVRPRHGAPSPGHDATVSSTTTQLSWSAVGGATGYHVQVSNESGFSSGLIVDDASVSSTSRSVSGLQASTLYYWRVAARDGNGDGSYAAAWTFTTAVASPSLVSPADNATNQPLTVTLQWSTLSGATFYHVQVATDAGFSSGIILDEMAIGVINGKTTAVRLIPVPGKEAGEMVSWGGLFGESAVQGRAASDGVVRRGRQRLRGRAGGAQRSVHGSPAALISLGLLSTMYSLTLH